MGEGPCGEEGVNFHFCACKAVKPFLFCALFLMPQVICAQVSPAYLTYLSNTSEPFGGSVLYGSDSWIAQSFETGTALGGYLLNGPIIFDGAGSSASELSFYTDNNGTPGAVIGGSGVVLSPSTVYWFVATASEPSQSSGGITVTAKSWNYASNASYSSADGWNLGSTFAFSVNGSDWTTDAGHSPFQFEINANPVPEPEFTALLGAGLLIFFQLRRRNR